MSALTDLFTALANKIRSKTGTATTYTPLEMVSDGIDDVYDAGYAAGGGGSSATPITPSNSSPASMTSGTTYEAQANGYAVSSVTSVHPYSSSPTTATLTAGEIYKPDRNGYAIDSYYGFNFQNWDALTMNGGDMYLPYSQCYAIPGYSTITPSDSSPVALTNERYYKMGAGGYAIASNPTSITPSASGTYFSSGIKKMTASGYAYTSAQKRTASGIQAMSTSAQTKITCGFKPNYIMAYATSSTSLGLFYNKDISTTKSRALNSGGNADYNLGTSTGSVLYSVDDDGFTVNKATSARTYYWFASE